MAEALAVVGLLGNIAQFVDYSTKIIRRLNEFRSSAKNAPNAFQGIQSQLRLLRSNLERTEAQANAGNLDDQLQKDIDDIVQGCLYQIERLSTTLDKILPDKNDGKWRKGMKVVLSVHQEKDVKDISACIDSYVTVLMHHQLLNIEASLPSRPIAHRSKSFSTLPYPRDPYFTGREEQIKRLDELFLAGDRAALFGLGGIGKSQVAIEYSHRFQAMDPGAMVLWVYASSIARIEEAYMEIARKAGLAGYNDPGVSKLELVSNWLKEEVSSSWLMIIDNADIEDTFFKPISTMSNAAERKSFENFIPSAPNGRALITSRNRAVAVKLTDRERVVVVPSFTETEGREMLKNAIGEDKLESEEEVKELLRALEYLPLAISQAAAYIDQHEITIASYLEILSEGDKELIEILSDEINDSRLRRDKESLNSVVASWKLSFDYLNARNEPAAKVLSLMSMLDGKSIPERLFSPLQLKRSELIPAVGALKAFSLIQEDSKKKKFTVHRLVHLATRAWIEKGVDAQKWHKLALEAVDKAYPAGKIEDWSVCNELEPHAEAVLTCESDDHVSQAQMAGLLLRSALDRYNQGLLDVALARAMKSLEIRQALSRSEQDQSAIAQCHQMLSWCYYGKKQMVLAINEGTRALDTYITLFGEEAEETMRARSNLSKFLTKNGDLERAYEIQTKMLEAQRRKLGEQHEDVLYTMNRLVNTLVKQKKHDQALKLSEALVAARRKASGDDHHATLTALANNATLLYDLGRTADALAIMRRVYEGQRVSLREEHMVSQETLGLIQQYEKEVEANKDSQDAVDFAPKPLQRRTTELIFQPVLGSPDPERTSNWSLP